MSFHRGRGWWKRFANVWLHPWTSQVWLGPGGGGLGVGLGGLLGLPFSSSKTYQLDVSDRAKPGCEYNVRSFLLRGAWHCSGTVDPG